jgi:hypothetical protein
VDPKGLLEDWKQYRKPRQRASIGRKEGQVGTFVNHFATLNFLIIAKRYTQVLSIINHF